MEEQTTPAHVTPSHVTPPHVIELLTSLSSRIAEMGLNLMASALKTASTSWTSSSRRNRDLHVHSDGIRARAPPLTFPPCARCAHPPYRFFLVSQSLAEPPITILHSYFCVRLCMIDVDTLAPRGFPQQYSQQYASTVLRTGLRTSLTGTQRTTSQPAQRHPICSLSPQQILARNTRSQTRRDAEHMSRSEPNTVRVQRGRVHSQ